MNEEGDPVAEYFNYINSLKTAQPDNAYDYTLILSDANSTCFDEAPITLNLNADAVGDRTIAELILNYKYHNIPYQLIDRRTQYKRYMKDMSVHKQAFENATKVDIDLYDHGIHLYRTKNNSSFSRYLRDKKASNVIMSKKLPKDVVKTIFKFQ